MEVHHHVHSPHGGTHKKKWTHYFWEFLMLFLAVFLGFMAENQREHFVEKHREKQFMISLVRDLELDTLQLTRIEKNKTGQVADIDSLVQFFTRTAPHDISYKNYRSAKSLVGSMHFFQNSGTLDQLKNSGGLRLIHKRNIVDSIESYDQQIKRIELRDQYENELGFDNTRLVGKLFKISAVFKKMADTITTNLSVPINEQYVDEYFNLIKAYQDLLKSNLVVQGVLKTRATNLIALIKHEYHLN